MYLLLPKQRAIQLAKADADWTQRMLDEVQLRRERREAAERDAAIAAGHELPDDTNRRGGGWATPASATTPTRSPLNERIGDVDPKVDFLDLEDPVPGVDYDPVAQLPVFRYAQLKELILNARAGSPDRDGHVRLSNLFKQLKASGPLRPIQRFASLEALDGLLEASPNFAEVVRAIRNRVILSQVTGQFHIPPMLLLGPPGVGKTRFAQSLARMLATDFFRYAMDSGTTGAALLGSDAHWANTQMGTLTHILTSGKAANPVFVLDEVDKANDSEGRYSAINALHSILEPETAGSLRDLSTRLVINASRVIWIGTANHPERIPESIHSRFKVFHIGLPTGAQTLKVAKSVVDSVLSHNGLTDFQMPGDDILRTVDQQPARAVYQAVEDAVCEAIAQGRRHLLPEDFKALQGSDASKQDKAHTDGHTRVRPKKRRQTLTLVRAELSEGVGCGRRRRPCRHRSRGQQRWHRQALAALMWPADSPKTRAHPATNQPTHEGNTMTDNKPNGPCPWRQQRPQHLPSRGQHDCPPDGGLPPPVPERRTALVGPARRLVRHRHRVHGPGGPPPRTGSGPLLPHRPVQGEVRCLAGVLVAAWPPRPPWTPRESAGRL